MFISGPFWHQVYGIAVLSGTVDTENTNSRNINTPPHRSSKFSFPTPGCERCATRGGGKYDYLAASFAGTKV